MFALASGIGRATAIAYARSGVEGICLADISSSGLSKTLQECDKVATNPKFLAITVKTNVVNEGEVKEMVEETMSTFGRLDYATNIAGVRWFPVLLLLADESVGRRSLS